MNPSVLVVDDSPTIRRFHAEVLREAGFVVHEAENGFAALEALAAASVDLVVVDVNMPVLDGLTFVERLRTDCGDRTPVLVVSSQAGATDRADAARRGADGYLVKPAEPALLVSLARRLVAAGAHR
jgi:two-component system chemotaxis response regulator CheY